MSGLLATTSRPRRGRLWRALAGLCALAVATTTTGAVADSASAAVYDPGTDANSMHNVTVALGAQDWWRAGYTGKGVDVAVIDTGVAPVPGLSAAGKVLHGPDLSVESQSADLAHLDTYGHGTFMAGLIAGRDATATAPYDKAPATAYRGVAPDARIVSIKVGAADGGTDVTQVIAAINWAIENRNRNGLNIRVINLSYGANSLQAADSDPLSFAVEQAWRKGIVVVAATGNTGYQRGAGAPGLASPAYNPYVLAIGGTNSMGTVATGDDEVGSYSASSAGCGSACKNPDVLAPGTSLQGLRVPNSFIDQTYPSGRLADRYFRGSGSSQAAAVTSGAVALILQKNPTATPDQVKRFLWNDAKKLGGFDSQAQGAGQIRLAPLLSKAPPAHTQSHAAATGLGTIERARGQDRITRDGVVLTGEKDPFGRAFNVAAWVAATKSETTWSSGTWNGNRWSGSGWNGNRWSGSTWTGAAWSGQAWTTNVWSGNRWSTGGWTGNRWSGNSWSGNRWTGGSWATGAWI